ncbi:MAG: hypothetical protein HYX24_02415 [Candidatus Aenigmarchaeota archaeon]|nr:hypothetical protein [Candidatus Aenigmarchaeota archaeon]
MTPSKGIHEIPGNDESGFIDYGKRKLHYRGFEFSIDDASSLDFSGTIFESLNRLHAASKAFFSSLTNVQICHSLYVKKRLVDRFYLILSPFREADDFRQLVDEGIVLAKGEEGLDRIELFMENAKRHVPLQEGSIVTGTIAAYSQYDIPFLNLPTTYGRYKIYVHGTPTELWKGERIEAAITDAEDRNGHAVFRKRLNTDTWP